MSIVSKPIKLLFTVVAYVVDDSRNLPLMFGQNVVSNFIKIQALVAEIFAKQYWCLFYS